MSLSDILACLDSTSAGQGRLKLALQLAQQHDAYLTAAYVLEPTNGSLFVRGEPAAEGRFSNSAAGPDPVLSTVARAEEGEASFRQALRLHGLDGDWRLIDGPDTSEVVELAKSVDLVMLGQYSRGAHNGTGFHPAEIAMACGRPLLIVPYAGEFGTVGKHVLIAWDGTREATRALNDALPLIETAMSATVMTVLSQEKQLQRVHADLQRVVGHLEHHGVSARAEETLRGDMAISDLLLSRAADLGADMIVAGAYHHSQLREALIGGVSRDLLRHMTVPVLMSH
jgi:nucleotide-binding universal stress UspA family protein